LPDIPRFGDAIAFEPEEVNDRIPRIARSVADVRVHDDMLVVGHDSLDLDGSLRRGLRGFYDGIEKRRNAGSEVRIVMPGILGKEARGRRAVALTRMTKKVEGDGLPVSRHRETPSRDSTPRRPRDDDAASSCLS
jgi:hypothetical protein